MENTRYMRDLGMKKRHLLTAYSGKNAYESLSYSEKLGHHIWLRRRQLGISRSELGEMIHLSHDQIERRENGTVETKYSELVSIANALSCPVEYLTPRL